MEEKIDVFGNKFNGRMQALASRGLGSGYFWESKATFNPAAIFDRWKIHLIYRAI